MDVLDDYGFDIGHYHISVFNAVAKMVLVVVAMFDDRAGWAAGSRGICSRMTSLDSAQQVLGEKLLCWRVGLRLPAGIDLLGHSLTALTVFSGAFALPSASACRRPSAT
jgi:hypothetical protein